MPCPPIKEAVPEAVVYYIILVISIGLEKKNLSVLYVWVKHE